MKVPELSSEQREEAIRLRTSGLSYRKVALAMNCDEKIVWFFFHPKPPPKAKKRQAKAPPPSVHHAPSSVPMARTVSREERQREQLTKPEMYRQLAEAVRNT